MRKSAPINIIVHYPKSEEDQQELAKRAAHVHATFVKEYIQKLDCPSEQKENLISEIIVAAKKAGEEKP